MRKKIFNICLATGIIGMLTGCDTTVSTSEEEATNVDVTAMADALYTEVTYEDTLSELNDDTALSYYGIEQEDVTECVVMVSTGATAEEIAVFEATDSEAAEAIKEACENRLEKQINSYNDYKPAEISRLDDAIIEASGNYIVYCVADDTDKVNEIIDEYFK